MSEPATDKQIAYLRSLGGTPTRNLTKEAATELISNLLDKVPPSQKQLDYLKRLGANIPCGLNATRASELIDKLEGELPPTKNQIEQITLLGGAPPKTSREAFELYSRMLDTASATDAQKQRALELGSPLPAGISLLRANELISDLERDADLKDGKPPSDALIAKIIKLGGDPAKAKNKWRAVRYIELLEDQQEKRIDEAVEYVFGDSDMRSMMCVNKPSSKIMKKALQFGDEQGWGPNWENPELKSDYNPFGLLDYAIYSVAPELLKKGERPPRMPGKSSQAKGKGCLLPIVAPLAALAAVKAVEIILQ